MKKGQTTANWVDFNQETPVEEGQYLVYAESADPDKPFQAYAWWGADGWSLIPEAWARAISHWAHKPDRPS